MVEVLLLRRTDLVEVEVSTRPWRRRPARAVRGPRRALRDPDRDRLLADLFELIDA